MNFLALAYRNLLNRKQRAGLTIIGIFIGIMAVVALISLGQGLEQGINEQFEEIGSDKLFIQARGQFAGVGGGDLTNPLTDDDVEVVRSTQGVRRATSMNARTVEVETGDQVNFYFSYGIVSNDPEQYELTREFFTVDIIDGRELRPNDRNAVLVGYDYTREDVFEETLRAGDRITVNGQRFQVAGVLDAVGNAADDRAVTMPQDTLRDLLGIEDSVYMIVAQVQPGEDPAIIGERVERELLNFRDLDEDERDFQVSTPEDLLASFSIILVIVQVVLTGIAFISLFVGGIGIMNTMYTSVLERTKEIGIMKAIGAKPKTIQNIFLAESAMLGLVGGILGLLIGLGISKGVELAAAAALNTELLQAYISWWLIIGALLFSVLVGMLSGYFPARAAAQQDAVESLRYE